LGREPEASHRWNPVAELLTASSRDLLVRGLRMHKKTPGIRVTAARGLLRATRVFADYLAHAALKRLPSLLPQ